MSDLLARCIPGHLATLRQRADAALARGGFDHLVVAAGVPPYQFLDDRPFPFAVNPHFKHWLPVTKAPGSWLLYTPGQKPKLIYLQPHDYWHVVPDAPAGYWSSTSTSRSFVSRAGARASAGGNGALRDRRRHECRRGRFCAEQSVRGVELPALPSRLQDRLRSWQ
jgi:hypothetical protein